MKGSRIGALIRLLVLCSASALTLAFLPPFAVASDVATGAVSDATGDAADSAQTVADDPPDTASATGAVTDKAPDTGSVTDKAPDTSSATNAATDNASNAAATTNAVTDKVTADTHEAAAAANDASGAADHVSDVAGGNQTLDRVSNTANEGSERAAGAVHATIDTVNDAQIKAPADTVSNSVDTGRLSGGSETTVGAATDRAADELTNSTETVPVAADAHRTTSDAVADTTETSAQLVSGGGDTVSEVPQTTGAVVDTTAGATDAIAETSATAGNAGPRIHSDTRSSLPLVDDGAEAESSRGLIAAAIDDELLVNAPEARHRTSSPLNNPSWVRHRNWNTALGTRSRRDVTGATSILSTGVFQDACPGATGPACQAVSPDLGEQDSFTDSVAAVLRELASTGLELLSKLWVELLLVAAAITALTIARRRSATAALGTTDRTGLRGGMW